MGKLRSEKETKELKERIQKDTVALLNEFKAKGYQTREGTNTHLISSIVADFVNKVIDQRKRDLSVLSLWETNDMSVIVPLMFARYRLYNNRHQPEIFDVSDLSGNLKIHQKVPNLPFLTYVGDNAAIECTIKTISFTSIGDDKTIDLNVPYDSAYAGSYGELIKEDGETINLRESETSETGVFVERDYVIMPNEEGSAIFVPLRDFAREFGISKGTIKITVYCKPSRKVELSKTQGLRRLQQAVDITPELLKFTLTQLLAKFPTFRGISKEETKDYLEVKYSTKVELFENEIVIGAPDYEIERIQRFVDVNSFEKLEVRFPNLCRINIHFGDNSKVELLRELKDFVRSKLTPMESIVDDNLTKKVYYLADLFFANKFLLEANKIKNDCKISIKTQLSLSGDLVSSNFAKSEVV